MIGKTLGHYEIIDLLGRGGMGEVYRARDARLDRQVALKILPREMSGDPERIQRDGSLPVDEALRIASQIASGLEVAHEQGIVHRDLKHANVKIAPDGSAKVLDFGLARAIEGVEMEGDPALSPAITAGMTQPGTMGSGS